MLEKVLQLSLNGLMAGAVLAVPAIGLTMIFAVLRFVNFSVASHMAVGAFAGYMLNAWAGLPAWIAIFGAFIGAAAVGIASDHVALRPLRGYSALTLAIASIALNLMIESAIRFSFGGRPRDFAIPLRRDWSFVIVGPVVKIDAALEQAALSGIETGDLIPTGVLIHPCDEQAIGVAPRQEIDRVADTLRPSRQSDDAVAAALRRLLEAFERGHENEEACPCKRQTAEREESRIFKAARQLETPGAIWKPRCWPQPSTADGCVRHAWSHYGPHSHTHGR